MHNKFKYKSETVCILENILKYWCFF